MAESGDGARPIGGANPVIQSQEVKVDSAPTGTLASGPNPRAVGPSAAHTGSLAEAAAKATGSTSSEPFDDYYGRLIKPLEEQKAEAIARIGDDKPLTPKEQLRKAVDLAEQVGDFNNNINRWKGNQYADIESAIKSLESYKRPLTAEEQTRLKSLKAKVEKLDIEMKALGKETGRLKADVQDKEKVFFNESEATLSRAEEVTGSRKNTDPSGEWDKVETAIAQQKLAEQRYKNFSPRSRRAFDNFVAANESLVRAYEGVVAARQRLGRIGGAIVSPTGQAVIGATASALTIVTIAATNAYRQAYSAGKSPDEAMNAALQAAKRNFPMAVGGAALTAGIIVLLNKYRPIITPGAAAGRAGVVGVAVSLVVAGGEQVLDNQQVKSGALDRQDANDRGTRRWWTTINGSVAALIGGTAGALLGPGGSLAVAVLAYQGGAATGELAADKVIENRGAGPAEAFTNAMKPNTKIEKQMVSLYEWRQAHRDEVSEGAKQQADSWMHEYQLSRLPEALEAMINASERNG